MLLIAPHLIEILLVLMPVSIQTELPLANIPTLDIARMNATEDLLEDAIEHAIGRPDNVGWGCVHTGTLGQGHSYIHTRIALAERPKEGRNLCIIILHVSHPFNDVKEFGETDCT